MGTVPAPIELQSLFPARIQSKKDCKDATTVFYLTAFGPFHMVPVNPTELIVRGLSPHLATNPLKPRAILSSCRILKVAAKSTREQLHAMYAALPATRPDRRTVFIHLGVITAVTRFCLEVQGKNEATFSCPDELGWTPIKHPIDEDDEDLSRTCRTSLDLDALMQDLRGKGYGVDISSDAGRFVCNWVYYNSLQMAERTGCTALFVHVPPISVVPVERQICFIAALLDSIAAFN